MTHSSIEAWRVATTGIAASLYMLYAAFCIMKVDSRAERLLAMVVFLLGAITIQLIRRS